MKDDADKSKKEGSEEERKVVMGGAALLVVVILLIGWGFFAVKKISEGPEAETSWGPPDDIAEMYDIR